MLKGERLKLTNNVGRWDALIAGMHAVGIGDGGGPSNAGTRGEDVEHLRLSCRTNIPYICAIVFMKVVSGSTK